MQRIQFVLLLSLLVLAGCHSAAPAPVVNPNLPAPVAEQPVKSAPPTAEKLAAETPQPKPQPVQPTFKARDSSTLPGELYVLPTPANARVRVMNIQPKFVQGMRLPAGKYQIEVTAPGYQQYLQWVTLDAGRMLRHRVTLKPE